MFAKFTNLQWKIYAVQKWALQNCCFSYQLTFQLSYLLWKIEWNNLLYDLRFSNTILLINLNLLKDLKYWVLNLQLQFLACFLDGWLCNVKDQTEEILNSKFNKTHAKLNNKFSLPVYLFLKTKLLFVKKIKEKHSSAHFWFEIYD